MKRKISLLLCILMFANMICSLCAFADDSIETSSNLTQTQKETLDILQTLGIVSDEYDELTLDLNKEVTRAEFAMYLIKFANIQTDECNELYYNDVPKTHYAYNEITTLTNYGYLSGVGNKIFAPETAMQTQHAYIVFLRLLGYGVYMETNGISSAVTYAEIGGNISSSTILTTGDLFTLMYNSLIAECYESDGGIRPSYSKGDTQYLYQTRKMKYFTKGTVTGVHGASIYNKKHENNQMIIDNEIIQLDNKDYFDYLGKKVNYIIQLDKSDEYTLIWIGEKPSQKTVKLGLENYPEYNKDSNELKYDADGTMKKYKLANNLTVIYNGGFYAGNIDDVLNQPRYEVTLLSVDETNDVAIVWSYENIVIESFKSEDKEVCNLLNSEYISLNPDDYDLFSLVTTSGEDVDFDELNTNDVISVFISQNNESFRGVLSRETASGSITSFKKDGIEVDGTLYENYDETKEFNTNAKSVELYLDYNGYIAYANYKFVNDNSFVGYVIKAYQDEVVDKNIGIKLLNENGNVEELETVDKIKFNGVKQNACDVIAKLAHLDDGSLKPQLMLLQKNSDGKITSISTSSENGGDGKLIKTSEQTGNQIWECEAASEQGIIGVTMLYDKNTKVFNVPADDEVKDAKDSSFSVSGVKNDGKYRGAVGYRVTEEDTFYEQYIVNKSSATVEIAVTDAIVSVSDKFRGLNEDDEEVDIIEVVSSNNAVTNEYFVSVDCEFSDICKSGKTISDLKEGDVIRIGIKNNELAKIELFYTDNTGYFFYGDGGWGLGQLGLIYGECQLRVFSATITAKKGAACKIETGYNSTYLPEKKNQVLNLANAGTVIVIYDGKDFYKGTYNDVNEGDFVIVQTYYNSLKAVIVHKK